MRHRRHWLGLAALAAGLLTACSFVQSLDYLQDGDPITDGGGTDGGGGGEAGAVPIPVADKQTAPRLLAQDQGALYWLSDGVVMTIAKSGGTARALGTVAGAVALAVEPDPNGAVYLTVGTDVFRVPKDGSAAGMIFKGATGAPLANTVIADESGLFLLQYDDNVAESQVLRMERDGAAPTPLVPDSGALPSTLNADSTTLIWVDTSLTNSGFVEHDKTANGPASKTIELGANDDTPASSINVAFDATTIFWATDGASGKPGVLSRKRDAAGTVLKLFVGTDETFGPVVIDAQNVYAVETTPGAILRVSKQGNDGKRIVTGLASPSGLVVDDVNVYCTVEGAGVGGGAVLRVAK